MEQSSAATIFLEQWLAICGPKKNNTAMSLAMYNSNVTELQASVAPTDRLTSRQQNLRRYFFLVPGIDREMKLAKKSRYEDGKFLYVVPNELLYETIMREHIATGHGGITKMKEYTKNTYSNVTQEAITLCLSLCNICEQKRKKKGSKSLVIRPIRSNEVHERMQADLIDMQGDPDGDYKYILTSQDHFTKMVHLRPIKQKTKEEVSEALLDIFLTTNGAPKILQTDNGREFSFFNQCILQMEKLWPTMRMVHGRPRHPQTQGSVERANAEVTKLLWVWRTENGGRSASWASGLKFVQFQINSTYNSGIKTTPCEAVYGKTASIGLRSTNLPPEILAVEGVITEDHYDAMCAGEFVASREEDEDVTAAVSSLSELVSTVAGPSGATAVTTVARPSDASTLSDHVAVTTLSEPVAVSNLSEPVSTLSGSTAVTAVAGPSGASTLSVSTAVAVTTLAVPSDDSSLSDTLVVPEPTLGTSLQDGDEIQLTLDSSVDLGDCGSCSKPLEAFAMVCNGCKLAIHLDCTKNNLCKLCSVSEERTKKRKMVQIAQEQQANKMLKRSESQRPPLQVGDNVRVAIPKVDRGRADPPNMLAVITSCDDHGGYVVGTDKGRVKGSLPWNALEKCKQNVFLSPEDVPDADLSIRQTVTKQSFGGGQGFTRCSCRAGCQNGRCKCKRSNVLCNSRCHPNITCKNKG